MIYLSCWGGEPVFCRAQGVGGYSGLMEYMVILTLLREPVLCRPQGVGGYSRYIGYMDILAVLWGLVSVEPRG
jgi:hypothetical protein